jgi:hypothetical protein
MGRKTERAEATRNNENVGRFEGETAPKTKNPSQVLAVTGDKKLGN